MLALSLSTTSFLYDVRICNGVISDFKDILQDKGLFILKSKVIVFLDPQRIEKKLLEKFKKKQNSFDDSRESLIDIRKYELDSALYKVATLFKKVADSRGNVDEYILAFVYPKTDYTMDDFYVSEKLRVAERLIESDRWQEALNWIESDKKLLD